MNVSSTKEIVYLFYNYNNMLFVVEFGGIPVLVVNNGIDIIPVLFLEILKYRFYLRMR